MSDLINESYVNPAAGLRNAASRVLLQLLPVIEAAAKELPGSDGFTATQAQLVTWVNMAAFPAELYRNAAVCVFGFSATDSKNTIQEPGSHWVFHMCVSLDVPHTQSKQIEKWTEQLC